MGDNSHNEQHIKQLEEIISNQQKMINSMDKRLSIVEEVAQRIEKWAERTEQWAEKSLEMHYRLDGVIEQMSLNVKYTNKNQEAIEKLDEKYEDAILRITSKQNWIIGVGAGLMTALTIAQFFMNYQ